MPDELGLAITFVSGYDPERGVFTIIDRAIILATHDSRDLPWSERFQDALKFLKSREH